MTLDPDTRRDLARAARMERDWRDKRDEAIKQAYAEGASLREIGEVVGLTHSGVDKIVKRS